MTKQAVLKDSNKSKKLISLLVISIAALVTSTIFLSTKSNSPQPAKDNSTADFRKIVSTKNIQGFTEFTKKLDPPKTYELLKKVFPANDADAHDFAHIIGIVAHDSNGIKGLSVCDTAYNYGCYHGFIEAFIAKNGVKKVAVIEEGCIALGTVHAPSCLHGIGHGVMVDASYKLDPALENCSILKTTSRIYCWDGVFMERIVGSMLTTDKRQVLTEATLGEPCNSVKTGYREQCWRNQVSAWFQFFGENTKKVGLQCSLIEREYQKTCFESLGLLVTITVGENAPALISSCQVLANPPTGGQVSDDCLIGAIKELLFEGKNPTIAQTLCNSVSSQNRPYCLQVYSDHLAQSQARFGR